jgi:hypothetical protein
MLPAFSNDVVTILTEMGRMGLPVFTGTIAPRSRDRSILKVHPHFITATLATTIAEDVYNNFCWS